MLTYDSNLQYTQPVSSSMRSGALKGILGASPYAYGPRHDDVYRMMAQRNAVEYDREASRANTSQEQEAQGLMRRLALSGLSNMNDEMQAQNRIANQNSSMLYGFAGNVLGGLF